MNAVFDFRKSVYDIDLTAALFESDEDNARLNVYDVMIWKDDVLVGMGTSAAISDDDGDLECGVDLYFNLLSDIEYGKCEAEIYFAMIREVRDGVKIS